MKILLRLLLLILCVALLVAVGGMYLGTTRHSHQYIVTTIEKWRGLREIRLGSLFAILAWCLIFARSEPTFVRIGLIAIALSFAVVYLPLKAY